MDVVWPDDDDDDDSVKWSAPPAVPVPELHIPASTRGSPAKREQGRGRGGGRRRGRGAASNSAVVAPTFEVAPPEAAAATGKVRAILAVLPPPRKRAPAKGATAQRAIRKKTTKATKAAAAAARDDAESINSTGLAAYAGTAASSPPKPDISLPIATAPPPIPLEDATFEGVPILIYPLPSKPFPVQPPVKIAGGMAPAVTV
ncbi:hypothetical protein B0H21DRAFT_712835 [Amylocystis lapponica]|nr:hypothetical protein B0H21DRAFT_712835 [Amylocystis lapponica]